ncbi:hypothetical protein, partial [Auraticoccus cholistanensis]|uniref:hypothetical protein n=1 Tax=Auraticoccus cholistanensis TaxID=2656650 RepID=UPI0018D22B7B
MSDHDELAALSERVRAIEERLEAGTPPAPPPPTGDFWVLEGLRARAEGPGAVVYAGTTQTADGPVEWQYGL